MATSDSTGPEAESPDSPASSPSSEALSRDPADLVPMELEHAKGIVDLLLTACDAGLIEMPSKRYNALEGPLNALRGCLERADDYATALIKELNQGA